MATALLSVTGQDPFANQYIDPSELDSYLHFDAQVSPLAGSSSIPTDKVKDEQRPSKAIIDDDIISLDQTEDFQRPAKPSHEYNLYKQQTGIPLKSVPGLESSHSEIQSLGVFNSRFDESSFMPDSSYDGLGSMSGLGLSADVNMDVDFTPPNNSLPAFFFPSGGESSQASSFVNPSTLSDRSEPQIYNRVWPGMHQQQAQQAALAKAQEQSQQSDVRQLQKQSLSNSQGHQSRNAKRGSCASPMSKRRTSSDTKETDPQTEAVINRVVNQIVRNQNSALASGNDDDCQNSRSGSLSNSFRMRKDEDDMDDDEKLLASEEGKKLSSKERRQLRNKVSARAFRSRRKEYISQLESEVAGKVNEANELRVQNEALMEENVRSRAFIQRLLRHPAFHPFLDDLSREPSIVEPVSQNASATTKDEQDVDFNSLTSPQSQSTPRGGSTSKVRAEVTVPLRGNPWPVPDMDIGTFESPRVYSVLELPQLGSLPLGDSTSSEKDDIFSFPTDFEPSKLDYPFVDTPLMNITENFDSFTDGKVDSFSCDLYDDIGVVSTDLNYCRSSPFRSTDFSDCATSLDNLHSTGVGLQECGLGRFKQICARMDPAYARVKSMTAHLDL